MLDKKLLSEQYYTDKTSLFLQNSYGILDHYAMLITILQEVDATYDELLECFDITSDEMFLKIESMSTDEADILDKFAHLYDVDRQMTITYIEEGQEIKRDVTLNNFELWVLIKAQILQNNFDGSYAQMREYYDKMKLPVFILTSTTSGQASVFLDLTSGITIGQTVYSFADNANIEYLFKAGYLTLKSMGIVYSHSTISLSTVAIWDSQESARSWDNARWGL